MGRNNILIITGQTATGKTAYAYQQAQKRSGELINADARQLYKRLDIVTGKDLGTRTFTLQKNLGGFDIGYYANTHEQNATPPIWLHDVVNPDVSFSAHDYRTCAQHTLSLIRKKNNLPVIVGGTYLYIEYLFSATSRYSVPPDSNLRRSLAEQSVAQLQKYLRSLDAHVYEQLNHSDKHNPHRLIRKIEIADHNKKNLDIPQQEHRQNDDYTIEIHGFRHRDKSSLTDAITNRVKNRLAQGAIEETQQLLRNGYTQNSPGLQAIGYREILQYIQGIYSYEQLIDTWITHEIQYAKRQRTFMSKNPSIIWHDVS